MRQLMFTWSNIANIFTQIAISSNIKYSFWFLMHISRFATSRLLKQEGFHTWKSWKVNNMSSLMKFIPPEEASTTIATVTYPFQLLFTQSEATQSQFAWNICATWAISPLLWSQVDQNCHWFQASKFAILGPRKRSNLFACNFFTGIN